mmetsp:Transcript_259/g.814  ORF Transcript_259/g.814 Transcript_259/m.814 type:complete len:262 (-) Transcript_259:1356-2141(-)
MRQSGPRRPSASCPSTTRTATCTCFRGLPPGPANRARDPRTVLAARRARRAVAVQRQRLSQRAATTIVMLTTITVLMLRTNVTTMTRLTGRRAQTSRRAMKLAQRRTRRQSSAERKVSEPPPPPTPICAQCGADRIVLLLAAGETPRPNIRCDVRRLLPLLLPLPLPVGSPVVLPTWPGDGRTAEKVRCSPSDEVPSVDPNEVARSVVPSRLRVSWSKETPRRLRSSPLDGTSSPNPTISMLSPDRRKKKGPCLLSHARIA